MQASLYSNLAISASNFAVVLNILQHMSEPLNLSIDRFVQKL